MVASAMVTAPVASLVVLVTATTWRAARSAAIARTSRGCRGARGRVENQAGEGERGVARLLRQHHPRPAVAIPVRALA